MARSKARQAKPYDVTFKHLVEFHPADALALADLAAEEVELVDTDLSTVVTAADKVLKVNPHNKPFLVQLEFQSGPDSELLERLFWYNNALFRRHQLPVWTVLLLLVRGADSPRLTGKFEIRLPQGRLVHHWEYQVVRVWETSVDRLLTGGLGVLPLAPLSDEAAGHVEEILDRMERRLQAEATAADRAFLWAATYFLMGLRYDRTHGPNDTGR